MGENNNKRGNYRKSTVQIKGHIKGHTKGRNVINVQGNIDIIDQTFKRKKTLNN